MTTPKESYVSFCATHHIEINPRVTDVLYEIPNITKYDLKLAGNNRLKPVERLDDKDAFALSESLHPFQGLTALDLRYNNITDQGVKSLIILIQQGSLQSLDLSFNDIRGDGAELLSQNLQGHPTLRSLSLSGNKVGRKGGAGLAVLLQMNHTLQVLHLSSCDLDVQSVVALAMALNTNCTLRCLDISRSTMSDPQEQWAVHFGQMLATNHSLLELRLGLKGLRSTGIERLSQGLLSNYGLKSLDLSCNRVTTGDVLPLVRVLLRESSSLEQLDLSYNQLRDEGAMSLSEALASPKCSLKRLALCSNSIRSDGLLVLFKVLSMNSSVTHFYIWGNHFAEPACQAFQELLQSGRLHQDHTDIRPYEVDGHMFLASVSHGLRKPFYEPENNSVLEMFSDRCSSPNTTSAAELGSVLEAVFFKDETS